MYDIYLAWARQQKPAYCGHSCCWNVFAKDAAWKYNSFCGLETDLYVNHSCHTLDISNNSYDSKAEPQNKLIT